MADIINNIVGGRYYILELVGRGGSAIVYKARDIHNGGIYALKKYITSDPANRKRLLEGMERELEVLKNCTHPVLPKIFDLIKIEDAFFLVMEYIPENQFPLTPGIGGDNNPVAQVEHLLNHFQLFQHAGVCLVALLGFHLTGD